MCVCWWGKFRRGPWFGARGESRALLGVFFGGGVGIRGVHEDLGFLYKNI